MSKRPAAAMWSRARLVAILRAGGQPSKLMARYRLAVAPVRRFARADRRKAERTPAGCSGALEASVKRRMAALQRSEACFSAIVETLLDAVIQIDTQGRMLTVNKATSSLFGWTEADLIGRNVKMLMPEPPREQHDGYLRRFLESGRSHVAQTNAEVIAQRRDGSQFPAELFVSELRLDSGLSFIGVIHDITDRRAIDIERETARQAAEQQARTKSEFLAHMSHEIRTPLNGVLGLARAAARDSVGQASELLHARILGAAERLLAIVNDILDFSKIEAGKLNLVQEPVSLPAVIDHVRSLVHEHVVAKGISFEVSLAPDLPPWLLSDGLRLEQILDNLVSNAIKFTEQGGVSLSVARRRERLAFAVEDTGIGMDDVQMQTLFQPFEQGDRSNTRRHGGSGLGLTISRRLAHMLGGEIKVESRLGAGSTFTLLLPLIEAEAPAPPPPRNGAQAARDDLRASPLSDMTLLAADDVELNRIILEDICRHAGADVVFAEDGQQALKLVKDSPPGRFDVVLMDVQMPVMDGFEATQAIAAIAPNLPVIGLTAHALEADRAKSMAAGMVDHVTKPVDAAQLIGAIVRATTATGGARRRAAQQDAGMAPAGLPAAPATALANWSQVEGRFHGDRAFVVKLARSALRSHADAPDKLRQALRYGDARALAALAHSLKNLAGNFAAPSMIDAAEQLESSLANSGQTAPPQWTDEVERLALACDSLVKELHAYTGS